MADERDREGKPAKPNKAPGRQARLEPVADELHQIIDRAPLGSRRKIMLLGRALDVEREDVAGNRDVDHLAGVGIGLVHLPELLERRPDWPQDEANAGTLSLGPLTHSETKELLDSLEVPAVARDRIADAADGNPRERITNPKP